MPFEKNNYLCVIKTQIKVCMYTYKHPHPAVNNSRYGCEAFEYLKIGTKQDLVRWHLRLFG